MKKLNKKWLLSLMLVLLVSLAITGCNNDADKTGDTETGDTQTGDQDTEDKVDDTVEDVKDSAGETAKDVEDDVRDMTYEDIKVKPEEVFDKFMEAHPDARIKSVDLDKELMDSKYVVQGYDSVSDYEIEINPVDGKIISDDSIEASSDNESAEITKEHLAKVDDIIDKAKEEDGSDSRLDEWKIHIDDGRV